ncbi:MAG TPA: hypothetical protein PK828_09045, partial [Limnochordia bacterium]|nr:hypothetical protein [Limnochordia bacterium]
EAPESSEDEVFTPDAPGDLDSYIADWPEDPWGRGNFVYKVKILRGTGDAREVKISLEAQDPADEPVNP